MRIKRCTYLFEPYTNIPLSLTTTLAYCLPCNFATVKQNDLIYGQENNRSGRSRTGFGQPRS